MTTKTGVTRQIPFLKRACCKKSDLEGVSFVCARQEGDGSKPTVFRKTFTLSSKPVSAKLYATALGVYESYINGSRTGRLLADGSVRYDELKPGSNEMGARKTYYTYDVTHLLREGENVLSAVVSGGWWTGLLARR